MEKYLGYDKHLIILGEKLNNFHSAKTQIEYNKYIYMAKEWIKQHPDEPYNFYN